MRVCEIQPRDVPAAATRAAALLRSAVEIAASLSVAHTIRRVERREELGERDAQGAGEAVDEVHRGSLLAALQIAQVGRVQPCPAGQLFL